jgi:rhodanese-related sulfurtransferase
VCALWLRAVQIKGLCDNEEAVSYDSIRLDIKYSTKTQGLKPLSGSPLDEFRLELHCPDYYDVSLHNITGHHHLRRIMFKIIVNSILLLTSISLFPGYAHALDEANVAEDKRTTLGLYYSSTEAAAFMQSNSKFALFLDVRDPHELQTTGMADTVDYNVPFNFINTNKWDEAKSRFQFDLNPNFTKDVTSRFKAKGLSGFDAIVLICTAGTRAANAVNALAKAGFKNVHTVVDGYNGWKSNDLKWNKKLDRSKMYGKVASAK